MKVGFCITCQGRAHHVARTLPVSLAGNPDALFVLLDYGSQDNLGAWVAPRLCDDKRLVYYRLENPGPFRMGHSKNMAHRLAINEGADILVNLDADNYAGEGFADYAREHFTQAPNSFLWARMIPGQLVRGISGRIALTASAFVKSGGYDEAYRTWGPDDKDLTARLTRMGYEGYEIPREYLQAIKHDNKLRFRAYPHAKPATDDYPTVVAETGTVVNHGRVGLGTVYRNFSEHPTTLGPIPTRLFGIGMHKTGTTSLARAFQILGYDSGHWKNPGWARRLYEEITQKGQSPTLEAHYALTDIPLPLLFRELDKAYPGSKFILTLRDENDWLESVRKHFSDANPYRDSWDMDAFTRKAHSLTYGRSDFHERTMRRRYRMHNADVRDYFANRPQDLLVMESPDWHDLCAFLGKPIPSVPYPCENVTREYLC
jgi:Sulfotransferase domain/N-terminal domain of galactosyltransferase